MKPKLLVALAVVALVLSLLPSAHACAGLLGGGGGGLLSRLRGGGDEGGCPGGHCGVIQRLTGQCDDKPAPSPLPLPLPEPAKDDNSALIALALAPLGVVWLACLGGGTYFAVRKMQESGQG